MLKPAIAYKEQIEKAFRNIQYSDKMIWYDGCIDIYDHEIKTEGDKYAFAIVYGEQIIGYVSFRVDWYCSMVYNFGLIKFLDTYFDTDEQMIKNSTPLMLTAIRDIIRMVESFNPHRIDFRCVGGNPAEDGYNGIVRLLRNSGKYNVRVVDFIDNIRDRKGEYRNTIMYELIRQENRG